MEKKETVCCEKGGTPNSFARTKKKKSRKTKIIKGVMGILKGREPWRVFHVSRDHSAASHFFSPVIWVSKKKTQKVFIIWHFLVHNPRKTRRLLGSGLSVAQLRSTEAKTLKVKQRWWKNSRGTSVSFRGKKKKEIKRGPRRSRENGHFGVTVTHSEVSHVGQRTKKSERSQRRA